jgi:hypothetical protein
MGLLNAKRFRYPYSAPTIHVSTEAGETVMAGAAAVAPQRVPALMPRYNIVPHAKIGAVSLAEGLSEIRVYDRLQMGNIAHIG